MKNNVTRLGCDDQKINVRPASPGAYDTRGGLWLPAFRYDGGKIWQENAYLTVLPIHRSPPGPGYSDRRKFRGDGVRYSFLFRKDSLLKFKRFFFLEGCGKHLSFWGSGEGRSTGHLLSGR